MFGELGRGKLTDCYQNRYPRPPADAVGVEAAVAAGNYPRLLGVAEAAEIATVPPAAFDTNRLVSYVWEFLQVVPLSNSPESTATWCFVYNSNKLIISFGHIRTSAD